MYYILNQKTLNLNQIKNVNEECDLRVGFELTIIFYLLCWGLMDG